MAEDPSRRALEAAGRTEQEGESEELVAGPGVVGTVSMWTGAGLGALAGAVAGALLALAFALFAVEGGISQAIIVTLSGAIGGGVFGFVAGGYLLPRRRKEAEEETDV
jgi:hypothetical protein